MKQSKIAFQEIMKNLIKILTKHGLTNSSIFVTTELSMEHDQKFPEKWIFNIAKKGIPKVETSAESYGDSVIAEVELGQNVDNPLEEELLSNCRIIASLKTGDNFIGFEVENFNDEKPIFINNQQSQ